MIYKMEMGRPMELNISINSTGAKEVYAEESQLGSVSVLYKAETAEVVFRCSIVARNFTLYAQTPLEIVESVRYLRSAGFLQGLEYNTF